MRRIFAIGSAISVLALGSLSAPIQRADAAHTRQRSHRPPSPVLISEFINEHAPYASSHSSTLAETSRGDLVAAWFGGSGEGQPDVGIWFARRGEHRWNPAVEVANSIQSDGTRSPAWDPVLFQAPTNGPLFLFYKIGPRNDRRGFVMTSADEGRTWSKPRRMPPGTVGPDRTKPVVLPDGTWLSGSKNEGSAGRRVHFELSRDQGRTWERTPDVGAGVGFDALEATILFAGQGQIEALARSSLGVVVMTWSSDDGRTWTPFAATTLPNPNSAVGGINLADGRLLVVYNNSAHLPNWSGHGYRYPLDVAMSCDGLNWDHVLTLAKEPSSAQTGGRVELSAPTTAQEFDVWGAKGFSYPSVIESSDGLVHITYTWNRKMIKHIVIDPRRLRFNQRCAAAKH